MATKCQFVKQDGTPCGSYARTGRAFCLTHDDSPDSQELRIARKFRAGKRAPGFSPVHFDPPTNPAEAVSALTLLASRVAAGEADPRAAQCASGALRTALEGMKLAERIDDLEKQVSALSKRAGIKQ